MMNYLKIKTPTLIVDKSRCINNIKMMAEKAAKSGCTLRPHFKTHQSIEVGRWYKDLGVKSITVSSVNMAEQFASEWDDITIAFPVNILEIDSINKISENISLNLLGESVESLNYLKSNLQHNTGIFIKIDVGYHRTGISPENTQLIDKITKIIKDSDKLEFKGFIAHSGHTYKCENKDEIIKIHENSLNILTNLKNRYVSSYPDIIASLGDTPAFSISDNFTGIDEFRPGNFAYYDLVQESLGSCNENQIAVAAACPIVSIHKNRNEIVVYGGGVHLSKEFLTDSAYGKIYGKIVSLNSNGIGDTIKDMYVNSVSQEHGIVSVPSDSIDSYSVGDILYILPVHSCMTANLLRDIIIL